MDLCIARPISSFKLKRGYFLKRSKVFVKKKKQLASDGDDDAFEEYYNETKADNEKNDGKLINFRLLQKLPN